MLALLLSLNFKRRLYIASGRNLSKNKSSSEEQPTKRSSLTNDGSTAAAAAAV